MKKLFEKLIIRLKVSYDIREDFIVLKNVKEYLFKLNNNLRVHYQFKVFKAIFIRIIIITNVFYIFNKVNFLIKLTSL